MSQGVYEGNTVRETVTGVQEVLSRSDGRRPTRGTLEAQSALVHMHALTGNLAEGRAVIDDMCRTVGQLVDPNDDETAVPYARTVVFRNYLECRIGSRAAADAAFAEAADVTWSLPVWHADASMSYGRILVCSDDVAGGIRLGLEAAARSLGPSLRTTMHVVGLGIFDLLDATRQAFHQTAGPLGTHQLRLAVPCARFAVGGLMRAGRPDRLGVLGRQSTPGCLLKPATTLNSLLSSDLTSPMADLGGTTRE